MCTLLLVRNTVSHDARVLRAARVAERALGAEALVVGVATASAPAGETTVEGVRVLRLSARRRPAAVERGDAATATSAPSLRTSTSRMSWRTRVRRVLGGASFAWRALLVARRERPALVQANDWNTMWCGVAIKLACGSRLIYDSHELWADRNGRWERRWWLLASEALFVRVADIVTTASPGYADELRARYRVKRPAVIRNIPDGPLTRATQPRAQPLAIYVGGLMPGRGLEQTIDALALAPRIRLRAIGPGAPEYRASLIERAETLGVAQRVELHPPVPPARVLAALADATAGLCLIQPVCRSYELTLPNKLFEYAAAGVPVLASDLPTIATVVRAQGLGEVVCCDDPHGIAAGLERLVAPARWSEAARRSHAFAKANDWSAESRALARIYSEALAGRAR
jgi:glycosyltransferase involved in cell wall biosynthesis